VRSRAICSLGVAAAIACARTPPNLTPTLDALGATWYPFRWVDATIGATRVEEISMLVRWPEASRDTNDLQLDFGLAGQHRFGFPIRNLAVDSAGSTGRLRGRVRQLGDRDDSTATAGLTIGTLGLLAFYFGPSTVLVDPVGQRIGRIGSSDSLPKAILDRMRWTPVREVEGRLLMRIVVDGQTRGEALVDPASGIVPVLLDSDLWREVTGAGDPMAPASRLSFPVPGGELVLEGAPARRGLTIGGLPLPDGAVYRVAAATAGSEPFADLGPIRGLVGAQLFARGRLLVVDLRRKRLGWYR
jgi:hypothetical protein